MQKGYAERKKMYGTKLRLYKKIGVCFKELQQYEQALYYFKKQLQLAWYYGDIHFRWLHDDQSELDAYDSLGIAYYYIGNVDKAIYYHNRMMAGELEPDGEVKQWNLGLLEKDQLAHAYKDAVDAKSLFESYKEQRKGPSTFAFPFTFPHEDPRLLAM